MAWLVQLLAAVLFVVLFVSVCIVVFEFVRWLVIGGSYWGRVADRFVDAVGIVDEVMTDLSRAADSLFDAFVAGLGCLFSVAVFLGGLFLVIKLVKFFWYF